MPKAYWIAHVDVRDAERYKDYVAGTRPALERYGGEIPCARRRLRAPGRPGPRSQRGDRVPRPIAGRPRTATIRPNTRLQGHSASRWRTAK